MTAYFFVCKWRCLRNSSTIFWRILDLIWKDSDMNSERKIRWLFQSLYLFTNIFMKWKCLNIEENFRNFYHVEIILLLQNGLNLFFNLLYKCCILNFCIFEYLCVPASEMPEEGGTEGPWSFPVFGRSVNLIPTRWGFCSPRFFAGTAALPNMCLA